MLRTTINFTTTSRSTPLSWYAGHLSARVPSSTSLPKGFTPKFSTSAPEPKKKEPWTWARVKRVAKEEWEHYKHGTKVFGLNMKLTYRLWRESSQTKRRLMRSEKRLISTTLQDFLRLGNLIPIIVIPAAEFALPVILKLFPGFLPSTYTTDEQRDKTLQARLKTKEQIIQQLQSSTDQIFQGLKFEGKVRDVSSSDLYTFWKKLSSNETRLATPEILKFSKLFHDLYSLEKLPQDKLVKICKFFKISSWGSSEYLRAKIRCKIAELQEDDEEILEEGVYNLTDLDLRQVVVARGIKPSATASRSHLIRMLHEWMELSSHAVPEYLLVLSRTQTLNEDLNKKLEETMRLEAEVKELERTQPASVAAPVRAKLEKLQQEISKTAAATPEPAPAAPAAAAPPLPEKEKVEIDSKMFEVQSDLVTVQSDLKRGAPVSTPVAQKVSNLIESMIAQLEGDSRAEKTTKDRIALLQVFKQCDANGDGLVSPDELSNAIHALFSQDQSRKITRADIVKLVNEVDKNKDGKIDFPEFQKLITTLVHRAAPVPPVSPISTK